MKKTVNDLNVIKNVFIHANNQQFMDKVAEKIPNNVRIVCADKNYIDLKNCLYHYGKSNEVTRLSGHNRGYTDANYSMFSANSFVSVLAEKYSIQDQSELNRNKIIDFDLIIIDLDGKDFFSFENSDLAAFFMLIAGIKNYSKIAIVSNEESLSFLSERIDHKNTSKETKEKQAIVDLLERHVLAQIAGSKVKEIIEVVTTKCFKEELINYELLVKSEQSLI